VARHCDLACVFVVRTAPPSQNHLCKFGFKIWHYVLYANLLILSELHFYGFEVFLILVPYVEILMVICVYMPCSIKAFYDISEDKLPPSVKILNILLNTNAPYILLALVG